MDHGVFICYLLVISHILGTCVTMMCCLFLRNFWEWILFCVSEFVNDVRGSQRVATLQFKLWVTCVLPALRKWLLWCEHTHTSSRSSSHFPGSLILAGGPRVFRKLLETAENGIFVGRVSFPRMWCEWRINFLFVVTSSVCLFILDSCRPIQIVKRSRFTGRDILMTFHYTF